MTFKELVELATQLVAQKKFSEAKLLYLNWLDRFRNCSANLEPEAKSELAVAYNNLGQLKYLEVDFNGAKDCYTTAIQNDPFLASAYFNRGIIAYRMGKFENALDDMLMATKYAPDNVEFQIGLERTKSMSTSSSHNS